MNTTSKNAALAAIAIACALVTSGFSDAADSAVPVETKISTSSVTVDLAPAPAPAPKKLSLRELVEKHASVKPENRPADCLARAVYFEARGEGLEGQVAVADVILNRKAHKRWADTICGVIRQPHQFSFVTKGVIPEPDRDSKAWKRSVAVAHIALHGLASSSAKNALYYHADYVSPVWRHALVKEATLGTHIFYS